MEPIRVSMSDVRQHASDPDSRVPACTARATMTVEIRAPIRSPIPGSRSSPKDHESIGIARPVA
jgi:hypothetical protein